MEKLNEKEMMISDGVGVRSNLSGYNFSILLSDYWQFFRHAALFTVSHALNPRFFFHYFFFLNGWFCYGSLVL